MKTFIAIESDTHAFHKLGLCNPDTQISEEDEFGNLQKVTPKLTKVQEHLWDLRIVNLAKLQNLADFVRIPVRFFFGFNDFYLHSILLLYYAFFEP